MRKLILLALVALVAGTLYAETSPGFSGSFEFYNTWDVLSEGEKDWADEGKGAPSERYNKEAFVIGDNFDLKVAVNGVIDEWTTVNAEISKKTFKVVERIESVTKGPGNTNPNKVEKGDTVKTDMGDYLIDHTGDDGWGKSTIPGTKFDDDEYHTLVLNRFTMTNNLTGPYPDFPVGVSITWGKTGLSPASFQTVANSSYLGHDNTGSYLGAKVAITFLEEKFKLITGVYPKTYLNDFYNEGRDKAPVFGAELQLLGLVEGLNANVFYSHDPNEDTDDDTEPFKEKTQEFGLTAGYTGVENLALGLATSYDLFMEKFGVGVSASYNFGDRVFPTLAFVVEQFPYKKKVKETSPGKYETATEDGKDVTEPLKAFIGLGARYKLIPDTLDVVFDAKIKMQGEKKGAKKEKEDGYLAKNISFDAGLEAFFGAVTYGLGFELRDKNTYSPNGDDSTGVYFKVKASF